VLWVPESNLAENFRPEFRPIFGQTWPQNPSRSTGLVLQCRLHHKSAPQTNSNAISWCHQIPARLPSGTQTKAIPPAWPDFPLPGQVIVRPQRPRGGPGLPPSPISLRSLKTSLPLSLGKVGEGVSSPTHPATCRVFLLCDLPASAFASHVRCPDMPDILPHRCRCKCTGFLLFLVDENRAL
jgi:hypothetical protein